MMNDLAEAQDRTQETFLRACVHRDPLPEEGAVGTWLYRIATNVCLDCLRRHTHRAPLESEADLDNIAPADTGKPSWQLSIDQNEMAPAS